MRVLLDECLPRKLKNTLPGHQVRTVPEMGWSGFANGKLLALIRDQFDFFVTVDRNLQFQQKIAPISFGVLVVSALSNRLADLLPVFEKVLSCLTNENVGKVSTVK